MITQMFTIYDSKAKIYNKPFFQLNIQVALRTAGDLVKDGTSEVANHPEDFTLFHIGSYDDTTGEIKKNETHMAICRFHELDEMDSTPEFQIAEA